MYWILVTALLVLVSQLSEAAVELEFSPSGLIKQGDDLTLTCSSDEYGAFEILKLVRIVGGDEYPVIVNGALMGVFPDHERYEVVDKTVDHQVVKIAGVLGADRGLWACVHINSANDRKAAEETINIIVPPNTLVLGQKGHQEVYVDVENGETVVFSQGHESGLRCVVTTEGSTEAPTVQITLGDSDITSSFTAEELLVNKEQDGLYEESIEVTYTGYSMPKPEDNGKQFTCTAKAENHHAELTSSVTLEVHYKPTLTCSKSQGKVKQGAEVEVSCSGEMVPKYDTAMYSFEENGSSVSISAGDTTEDGNLHFMVKDNGDSHTFTLHVLSVRAEDFRTYSLEVTNSQGTASASVHLEEVVEPETPSPAPATTVVNNNNNNNNHNNNNNNNNQGGEAVTSDGVYHALSLLTLLTVVTVGRLL